MKKLLVICFIFLLSVSFISAFSWSDLLPSGITGKVVDESCVDKCLEEKCGIYERVLVKRLCENKNKEDCDGGCDVVDEDDVGSASLSSSDKSNSNLDSSSSSLNSEDECQPVTCSLYCENGFKTDEEGCEVCGCVEENEGMQLWIEEQNKNYVKINGYVSGNPDYLEWDWGDGTTERGFFANEHWYDNLGDYAVHVKAYRNGNLIAENNLVIDVGGVYQNYNSWTSLTKDIGRFSRIEFHPINPNIIYAVVWNGGIYRSVDNGNTWTSIINNLPEVRINDILVDPAEPNAIYVGTVFEGIWKSEDRGDNWQFLFNSPSYEGSHANSIWISEFALDSEGTIYAASDGLYKSENKGNTWEILKRPDSPCDFFLNAISINPKFPNIIYVGGCGKFYKSMDYGMHWQDLSNNIENNDPRQILILNDSFGTILVSVYGDDDYYRSTNGGQTFQKLSLDENSYSWSSLGVLRADPYNSNRVFGGGVNFYVSEDAGQTFHTLTGYVFPMKIPRNTIWDLWDITFDSKREDRLMLGNDGGIQEFYATQENINYLKDNFNNQLGEFYDQKTGEGERILFRKINTEIKNALAGSIIVDEKNPENIIVGPTDYSSIVSFDNGENWDDFYGTTEDGDFFYAPEKDYLFKLAGGDWLRTNKTELDNCFLSNENIGYGCSYAWNWIGQNLPKYTHTMTPKLISSYYDGIIRIIYVGTADGIYYTIDYGDTWTKSNGMNGWVSGVDVSQTNPLIVYSIIDDLQGSSEIYKSTDGGINFAKLNMGTHSYFRSIAVSKINSNIVFLGTTFEGLWISKDGGQTFTQNAFLRWHSFNMAGVTRILFHINPNGEEITFIGTPDGLSMTPDYGETWYYEPELNKINIYDIYYHKKSSRLYLASYGNGVLVKTLPNENLWGSWRRDNVVYYSHLMLFRKSVFSEKNSLRGIKFKSGIYTKKTLYEKSLEIIPKSEREIKKGFFSRTWSRITGKVVDLFS